MFVDFVSAVPVGAGHVQWPSGRTTLITKLRLRFTPSGALELERTPPALTLDQPGVAGELTHPSDFAPYKPRCDVAIVGPGVLDRAAPGYLVVGSLTVRAGAHQSLGAHPAVGATGDPLARDAIDLWQGGDVDFARFQTAPAERQMVHPTASFAIQYARGSAVLSGRFEGPFPRAFVASGEPSRMVGRVPLSLDTVLVDPIAGTVDVVFRGVYERTYASVHAERVVLDVGPGAPPDPALFARWPARPLTVPSSVDLPRSVRPIQGQRSPLAPQETSVLVLPVAGAALPFAQPAFEFEEETHTADAPVSAGWEDDTTAAGARARGPTLPFQRAGVASPAPRMPSVDLAALRAAGARPVTDAWGADETLMGRTLQAATTAGQAWPPSAAPSPSPVTPNPPAPTPPVRGAPMHVASPFGGSLLGGALGASAPAAPPLVVPLAGPARTAAPVAPPAPAPTPFAAPTPPPFTAPSAAAPAPAHPADASRVQAIMQEVWKGQRPLADILAAHGLTDAEWRVLRRNVGRQT